MPKAYLIPATYVPEIEVMKAEIVLTASQINNLFSAPVEIVPAPGVGKTVVVRSVTVKHEFGTVEFGTTPIIAHAVNPSDMGSLIVSLDFVMQNVGDQMRYFQNASPFSNWPIRENQAVVV